ncbi:MAG TPA: hypothetical protein VG992_01550 [Candidatus Saccharimonadales bacterium]|nr:hypothetical protein [Candidatus Saccharimonadales bacterium]
MDGMTGYQYTLDTMSFQERNRIEMLMMDTARRLREEDMRAREQSLGNTALESADVDNAELIIMDKEEA